MTGDDLGDQPTLEGVRGVLRRVATTDPMMEDLAFIAMAFDEADLDQIADLAWRHQFADDRNPFKRDMRSLQQHVARKAAERAARE